MLSPWLLNFGEPPGLTPLESHLFSRFHICTVSKFLPDTWSPLIHYLLYPWNSWQFPFPAPGKIRGSCWLYLQDISTMLLLLPSMAVCVPRHHNFFPQLNYPPVSSLAILQSILNTATKMILLKWKSPTSVLLPGRFHGQRRLMGYSPQGRKELGMTEWHAFSQACACRLALVLAVPSD